jgi:hypothetical protein
MVGPLAVGRSPWHAQSRAKVYYIEVGRHLVNQKNYSIRAIFFSSGVQNAILIDMHCHINYCNKTFMLVETRAIGCKEVVTPRQQNDEHLWNINMHSNLQKMNLYESSEGINVRIL